MQYGLHVTRSSNDEWQRCGDMPNHLVEVSYKGEREMLGCKAGGSVLCIEANGSVFTAPLEDCRWRLIPIGTTYTAGTIGR